MPKDKYLALIDKEINNVKLEIPTHKEDPFEYNYQDGIIEGLMIAKEYYEKLHAKEDKS